MRILFVHQNFPAQFGRLAIALSSQNQHELVFLTARREGMISGVRKVLFQDTEQTASLTHPYLFSLDKAVRQGEAAYEAALKLKREGFYPDVIYGHCGYGAELYLKDLFPKAAFVGYFEWFYRAHGSDAEFGPHEKLSEEAERRIRTRNAVILQDLYTCDAAVSPTYWQQSQFPVAYAGKIRVVHDGIDTASCYPAAGTQFCTSTLDLSQVPELITYVARGMDPYRGFMEFMEAVSILQKERPQCHVVVVGAERIAYGSNDPDITSYKQKALESFSFDHSRLHFTGLLPYSDYQMLLQASTVHVYLTRPFVLSWSMLEAMASGCALVASNTAPVQEMLCDEVNGCLVDFFSPREIADRVMELLNDPMKRLALGIRARMTILERYELNQQLTKHYAILEEAVAQKGGA